MRLHHGVIGGPRKNKKAKPFIRRVNLPGQEIIIEEDEPEDILIEEDVSPSEEIIIKETIPESLSVFTDLGKIEIKPKEEEKSKKKKRSYKKRSKKKNKQSIEVFDQEQ